MNSKKLTLSLFFVFFILLVSPNLFAWGLWAHYRINKGAVLALPPEMGMFMYNHADYLTEESVVPDIRKHAFNDKNEFIRHFIDLEGYRTTDIKDYPKTIALAKEKFGADTLNKYGILPWQLTDMMERLTKAFKNKSKAEILFLSADFGHYMGDAHMPLHTTINYDGQLTGQKGIHGFWEGQLPEMFGNEYNLYCNAEYIADINAKIWSIIEHTNKLADTMLTIEKTLRAGKSDDKIYQTDSKGNIIKTGFGQPKYTIEYATAYHTLLNGMVEKQLKASIKETADLWYTAWVNAGKPDLADLDTESITKRSKEEYKIDNKSWKSGKVEGFKTSNEF